MNPAETTLPIRPADKPLWIETLGLTLLFEPEDTSSIVADVVFVHGLQGHPWRTWRFKGTTKKRTLVEDSQPSKRLGLFKRNSPIWETVEQKQRIFWPRDILPGDVPNTRIFTYGYNSRVSRYFSGPTNQSNISQHGLALLNCISDERHDYSDRPLIFVAHSLGGLLVKQALIESFKYQLAGQDRNLHHVCKALIFFGTPHRGSPDASLGLVVSRIAKALQFDVNESILRDLDPSSGSSTLSGLVDDFNSLLMRQKIRVYTFQEAAGKTGFRPASGKVVPDESSSFGIREFETRDQINKNHMEMCRFEGRDDDGYKRFLGALNRCLRSISHQTSELEARRREDRRQDILECLDFAERSAREQHIENANALATTLDWIWHISDKNSSFTQWLANERLLFWIQGKPASGKSTLMNYLNHSDEVYDLLTSDSGSSWEILRFFFDFRATTNTANNLGGLLRSLLFQILEAFPSLEISIGANPTRPHKSKHEWTDRELRDGLFETLRRLPKNVCMFIDGLDEYQGSMHELVSLFQELTQTSDSGTVLKICLASRPEPVIALSLGTCPGFRMQDHNFDGIESYVSKTITSLRPSQSDEVRLQQLSAYIAHKADGVFLWARFAVSEVISGYAGGENEAEIDVRLEALPRDLEDLYTYIFERMRPEDRNEARLMFQLVCFAHGPSGSGRLGIEQLEQLRKAVAYGSGGSRRLAIEQLREALATAEDCMISYAPEDRIEAVELFRKRLRAKSGGLLEDVPAPRRSSRSWAGSSLVKTIHRTVDSYLDRESWLTGSKTGQVEHTSPHALWLYICCKSIQSVPRPLEREPSFEFWARDCLSKHPLQEKLDSTLYEYACEYLFFHARQMESEHGQSSFGYMNLVSSSIWCDLRRRLRWNLAFENERITYDAISYLDYELDKDAIDRVSHPWQIMVEQGLTMCVRDALKEHAYHLLSNGHDISIAICCLSVCEPACGSYPIGWQDVKFEYKAPPKAKHGKYLMIQGMLAKTFLASRWVKTFHLNLDSHSIQELIRTLIEFGALVSQNHIIECLYVGSAAILEMLLNSWPTGRLKLSREASYVVGSWLKPQSPLSWSENSQLEKSQDEYLDERNDTFTDEKAEPSRNDDSQDENLQSKYWDFVPEEVEDEYYDERNDTYAGESVGPLWELARGVSQDEDFESMLDLLLARGELLDEICGPGGTMLHALIIRIASSPGYVNKYTDEKYVCYFKRIQALIERGANVNVQGPRGTPLEFVWKILKFCWVDSFKRVSWEKVMVVLREAGADGNLVNCDGSVITKEEIDDLCHIFKSDSDNGHVHFSQSVYWKPDWYTYDVPLLASHRSRRDHQPPTVSEYLKEYHRRESEASRSLERLKRNLERSNAAA